MESNLIISVMQADIGQKLQILSCIFKALLIQPPSQLRQARPSL